MTNSTDKDLGQLLQVYGRSYIRILAKILIVLLFFTIIVGTGGDNKFLLVLLILFSPYLVFLPLFRLIKYSKIELYENGIRAGKTTLYWNEIDAISTTYLIEITSLGVFHIGEYRLYRDNQKVLSINYDYAKTDKLMSVIIGKTAELLIPKYLLELEQLGEVHFGAITLNRQQISVGRRSMKLAEIGRVYLWDNALHVGKRGTVLDGIMALIVYMKNYHILVPLIKLLVQDATGIELQR
jgi:hypothetical protein